MKHMYMNTRCGYMRIIAGLMVMVMIIVAISINPAFIVMYGLKMKN